MNKYIFFLLSITSISSAQDLTVSQANHLATLPIKCLQQEYPNKLSQLLIDSTEIASPKILHPAFYGCFDWHSSVHGHWSLVYLLNHFPEINDHPAGNDGIEHQQEHVSGEKKICGKVPAESDVLHDSAPVQKELLSFLF